MSGATIFRIGGSIVTEERARQHFIAADADNATHAESTAYFAVACQQSSRGYAYRSVVEDTGVTIRHAGEEQ